MAFICIYIYSKTGVATNLDFGSCKFMMQFRSEPNGSQNAGTFTFSLYTQHYSIACFLKSILLLLLVSRDCNSLSF